MFTTLFSLSLFIALIRSVLAQSDFTIYTPTFVQCELANISWTDTGNPPYDLLIVSAADVCGPAIEDLGYQNTTSIGWLVAIPSGQQVVLSLMDAAGAEAWSGEITVASSGNNSCLPSNSSAPAPSLSGTILSIPPTAASSKPSTTLAPAGAAGAGIVSTSGTLPTRPLTAVTLLGSTVLTVVLFAL